MTRTTNSTPPSVLELFAQRQEAERAGDNESDGPKADAAYDRSTEFEGAMAETAATCVGEIALKLRVAKERSPDPLIISAHDDLFRLDPDTPVPEGKPHAKHQCPEDRKGEPWPAGPGRAGDDNAADAIVTALLAMPERQRLVFVLARFERWTSARIAHHLGLTPAQADAALRDALMAVHDAIGPKAGNGDPAP